ncbi:ABC transporter ATP-binding protein [Candidatus Uhrbacteria bacterium]|nr:ABC transporter ATP-binding protein [Candidatus Uhrbacteria bacterium]
MLSIKNLTKHFGGVRAVDHCSFEVTPARITALIGPNGAGKTTLFNCIAGVHLPEAGQVIFAGRDITTLPIYLRAQFGLSRTFQLVRTFKNMTVEENLRLAAEPDDQNFWRSILFPRPVVQTYLKDMLRLVGLNQSLKFPAKSLSYGQSKLLSLARALLQPHKILMLDEPVAGVAPTLRQNFKTLLPELKARGETIFFIEHDMDFVRAVADHVIVMDQGKVLTEGTPEQVLKDQRVLDAYLGEQL